jgi:hypothetical protein
MGPDHHAELGATTIIAEGADGLLLPGSPLTPEFQDLHLPGMEFLSVLGRGGMGVVFLARQKRLDRLVAVKMLATELANNEGFIARLEREAKTLATLSHPNVVGCHDMISTKQGRFLVMEYVPGLLSVTDLLLRFKTLPEAVALRIAIEVCRGLSCAQEKGITHRDIKPDNLQFYWDTGIPPQSPDELYRFPNSRVMICDFGIALTDDGTDRQVGKAIGSPLYMAPEQYVADRGPVDNRADIYALGATLYHMKLKSRTDIPDPREREKEITEATAKIVCRMGRWDSAARYASYPELIGELQTALHAVEPVGASLRRMMPHIPFLWGLAIGGACFFAIGAVIGARRLSSFFVSPPVSRTASLGYWDGDRSSWRMAQADAEMDSPAIMCPGGGGSITLRQKLTPGTRVRLKARIPIAGVAHIGLVDEAGVEHWYFTWTRLHRNASYACGADGQAVPLPEIATPESMGWLDLDFRLGTKRIVLLVNGEMTSVVPLKDEVETCQLRLLVPRGLIAQFRDVLITQETDTP